MIAFLCLLSLAPFQEPIFEGEDPFNRYWLRRSVDSSWTTQAPSGSTFDVLQVGRIRAAWDPDVVILRGGELQLAVSMASRDRVVRLAVGRTGAVVLPGLGSGGPDAILTTGAATGSNPSGAALWTSTGGAYPTATELPGLTGFSSTTSLRVGATGGIYGLKKLTITSQVCVGQIVSGAVVPVGTIALPAIASDIQPLDYDANGSEDIAIVYPTTVEIRSASTGAVLWSPPWGTFTENQIAVSRGHGGERDALVWTGVFEGAPLMTAFHSQRTDPLTLLPAVCVGLASFDYDSTLDSPAREDVWVSCGLDEVQLYRRLPESFSAVLATNPESLDLGVAAAAELAGGDVDGDGDTDVLLGLSYFNIYRCALNDRIERHDLGPVVHDIEGIKVTSSSLGLSYSRSPMLPAAVQLEVEVGLLGLALDEVEPLGTWSYELPAGSGIQVEDIPIGTVTDSTIVQLLLREVDSNGFKSPTTAVFVWFSSAGVDALIHAPEIFQYMALGGGNPGDPFPSAPPSAGFTLGGGGRNP